MQDQKTPISRSLQENMEILRQRLGIGVTFDVIERQLIISERPAVAYFVDGFIKDKPSADILVRLQLLRRADAVPNTVKKIIQQMIGHAEVSTVETIEEAIEEILSGPMVLFFEGQRCAVVADVREYPTRSIEEPELERVTRGSHEGFVETIVFNTAMIRRRLRDPNLRFESLKVGLRSKTDVAIGYIGDLTDPDLVQTVKQRIEGISIDALPTGIKNIEEFVVKNPWNPLPKVRYTERPDVAVAHLLEGHVIVFVDTTPMAMILPVTFFHFLEHAEEFFQFPLIGTYLRLVRAAGFALAAFLTPIWIALTLSRGQVDLGPFSFIGPKETSVVPLGLQLIMLEFGIDLIRMALIHTPSALATSLGIVGAILLGDLAVSVGLFVPETILYTAVVAIGYFAVPSIEFGLAIRLYRYLLLVLAIALKIPGLIIGVIFGFLVLAGTRSIKTPYLWPLIPFHGPSLARAIFRFPTSVVSNRPPFLQGGKTDRSKTSEPGATQPAESPVR